MGCSASASSPPSGDNAVPATATPSGVTGIGSLVSWYAGTDPGKTRSRYQVRGAARNPEGAPGDTEFPEVLTTNVRSSAAPVTPVNPVPAGAGTVASRLPVSVWPITIGGSQKFPEFGEEMGFEEYSVSAA